MRTGVAPAGLGAVPLGLVSSGRDPLVVSFTGAGRKAAPERAVMPAWGRYVCEVGETAHGVDSTASSERDPCEVPRCSSVSAWCRRGMWAMFHVKRSSAGSSAPTERVWRTRVQLPAAVQTPQCRRAGGRGWGSGCRHCRARRARTASLQSLHHTGRARCPGGFGLSSLLPPHQLSSACG